MTAAAVGAEQSVLGSVIIRPDIASGALAIATPEMYELPKHEDLATVLADMLAGGEVVDPQTVLARITMIGLADKIGGAVYLHTLMERAWSPTHAADYAESIRDAYRLRMVGQSAERLMQRLTEPDIDLTEALALHSVELAGIEDMATVRVVEPAPSITSLLASPIEYDWIVDGLLERGDRMILTGGEGGGKSTLLRQLASFIAAGLHPFDATPIPPRSVLVVDAENSRRQNRRRYGPIVAAADRMAGQRQCGAPDWDRLRIAVRPEGLELTTGDDLVWLDRLITASRPDILVLGPLYKLHAQNMNDELAARQLTAALDSIRVRHGVVILTEAHAGHAEDGGRKRKMRPAGSSLFMRWPEFGYGLRRSDMDQSQDEIPELVDVVAWRGSREERDWPQVLKRGADGIPWIPHHGLQGVA